MNTFKTVKDKFDEIYGTLPIPVVLFDNKVRLIKVNQSFLNLTWIRSDDLHTYSMFSFFKVLKIYSDGLKFFKNLPPHYVTEITDIDGNSIPVRLNYKELKEEDGLYRWSLLFITDLGELNTSKENVKRLTIENEALKDQLADEMPDNVLKERKRLEQEIKDAKEFLEDVLESCGDGILILDSAGIITRVNESFAKMLGKETNEIEEAYMFELGPLEGTFRSTTGETIILDQSYLENQLIMLEKFFKLEDEEKIDNWEYYAFDKNRELVPIELTVAIQKDSEGVITGGVGSVRDLTKKRIAEKELRESKDFLENIFKTTADGIIVTDNNGNIVRVNREVEKITGYREDELVGKHIMEMSLLDEEHRKAGGDMVEQLYEKGCVKNWEHVWYRKDGSLCPVEFNITFLRDHEGNLLGSVAAIRDITERKRAEKKLKETKDQLDNIIESSLDAIIVTDPEGYITRANDSYMKLLGYKQEEIIGKHVMELFIIEEGIYESTAGELVEINDDFLMLQWKKTEKLFEEEKISNWESYWLRKDKKIVPVEANIAYLYNEEGEITGAVGINRDITEREKAEKKIRESKEFLENIFKTTADGIVVTDNNGNIVRVNRTVEKITGYREDELTGKHIMEMSPLDEEHKKAGDDMMKQLYEKGFVENWEHEWYRKDGSLYPVETNAALLRDRDENLFGSVGAIRDITERKQGEKKIKEAKDQLDNIIESSLDAIVVTDSTGYVTRVNSSFMKLLGYKQEDIIGKHIMELSITEEGTYESIAGESVKINEEFFNNTMEIKEKLFDEEKISYWENYLIREDNKVVPIEINIAYLYNHEGDIIGAVGISRDITERKKAEKALQEANQFRRQFFTNITHEFRTPLTLAMGPLEGILRGECGKLNGNLRKQLSLALKNSRKLLKLINQLLDFSKLESGSQSSIYEKRNLKEFIARVLDSFAFIARKKKIDLTFNPGDEINEAYMDPIKTEKVLFNLIGNAFKFTPEGGNITVILEKDNGSANKENDCVKISVKDSGIGIKKEYLTHIFERFRQANGSTAREYGGTGIGLALSKELVELMDGTIEVESDYGRGSTFSIHLPTGKNQLKKESHSINGSEVVLSQQPEIEISDLDYDQGKDVADESIGGKKPLILIIDDNPDMRKYISGILKKDYDISSAQNGLEGLKKLDQHQPDLILCDIMMPRMDGYEFCKAVKSNPELKHIPLIFLTAKADTEFKIESLEEGADDYIVKPFNSLELLARVKSLLRIRTLMSETATQKKEINNIKQKLQGKYHYGNIIGNSPPMRKIYQTLETIKDSDSTILISGETGTGKELIANAIHYNSPRRNGPMISVNCGAIPKKLMEREFFGHVKGAYTGAVEDKRGHFEEANGGTLFLDEIAEMDTDMQVKLLRVLESGEIVRVGSSEPTKVDVRLIAAASRDLLSEVEKGGFRKELYYRIHVIPIHLPPLRERREDIPLLIEHFLKKFQSETKKEIPSLSEKEMSLFMNYSYPGNVRELEHIIERFCLLDSDVESLFNVLPKGSDILPSDFHCDEILPGTNPLKKGKAHAEKEIITHALKSCGNNYAETAKKLNISRAYLYRKMKEYRVNG